uniref:Death domain-containing protein n=3 Tax=Amphimedon queenslandica TaxID=400682 RepID=A0A1X7TPK6_AMPQE
MWGGLHDDLPELVHNNEKKKSMCSVVEVCHVPTGEWVQKPTTGDPPLGVWGYAAAVIRNEIFFFGGYCGHDQCYHNSLYSFNVDTFNWKELSPTSSHYGPMMKTGSSMIAIKVKDEDYLVVIGGGGSSSNNNPPQPGAQYSDRRCNEIHLYRLKTGKWTSPTVTGDRPPPINSFTLTSITTTTAILFGGYDVDEWSNDVYVFEFTDTSVKCTKFSNPGGSVQWPKERSSHSSVLINCSSGPHLLVVGGFPTSDCWLLNINKMEWKELTNIPDSVTDRMYPSLSVWNETQTTHWIIEFGGMRDGSLISDTRFIEIISSTGDFVVQSVLDINEYQKRRIQDAVGKWMEEGSVDLTVTRLCDLIRLLLHLNIITELEDEPKGHYFIPYVLPSYIEPVSIKETNAKPLLIVWREEESEEILPVPTGLFPLTIVHLLNQKEYVTKISPSAPGYYKFRDAMSLKIMITSKHSFHLINRYTHIEVYFTGPTRRCPLVRKLLTTAINNSSDAMHLKRNYVNAFACPYNESCYCIVNEDDCTVCGKSSDISSDYSTWFDDAQDILDKKPKLTDLHRLFDSSAGDYMIIGAALKVKVDDLPPTPGTATNNLLIVFKRWIESNKGVSWRNALRVCKDYPDKFGRVMADVDKFLESDRACKEYLLVN